MFFTLRETPNAIKLRVWTAVMNALRLLTTAPDVRDSPSLSIAGDKEGKARYFS